MLGVDFDAGDLGAGACKPDGRVTAQGSDFEYGFGVNQLTLDG
jgi:hypothetical protein